MFRSLITSTLIAASIASPALADVGSTNAAQQGKILYQPYVADVNRYNYALNDYERNGGFKFNDEQMGKCRDPYSNLIIEGRVLVVTIDRCLADKLMAKRYMIDGMNGRESGVVEGFMWNLQTIWNNTIAPNKGYHELKLRAIRGGVLGSIYNSDKFVSPSPNKIYVSNRD